MNESIQVFYRRRPTLITGGLGFIGSHLAQALIKLDAQVTIVDSMIAGDKRDLDSHGCVDACTAVHIVDLRNRERLGPLVAGQEVIFNLAGDGSHLDSMRHPMRDLESNCQAPLGLLESCREWNPKARIVHTSTRQVYGKPSYLPVDERHPHAPCDINGIHKHTAELYFQLYARVYSMQFVCLRLTNTYGPRMDLVSPNKGFIGVFLRRALRGEKITVFGTGHQRRDFNHVTDVVEALLLAGYCQNLVGCSFNLGSDQNLSMIELLETLNSIIAVDYEIVPFPEEQAVIDIGDYVGNYSLFRRFTGWRPCISLRVGLKETIETFQSNPFMIEAHKTAHRSYAAMNGSGGISE